MRRILADPTAVKPLLTAKKAPSKKGPRAENNGRRVASMTTCQIDTDNTTLRKTQSNYFVLNHGEVVLAPDVFLDSVQEQRAIRLDTWTPNCAPLRPVEHAIVNCTRVRGAGDDTIERIHFTHEMTFPQPADRRIAAHRANFSEIETHQRCLCAHARRCARSFYAGMPAADNKDIKVLHGWQIDQPTPVSNPHVSRGTLFSDAETAEQHVEHFLGRIAA